MSPASGYREFVERFVSAMSEPLPEPRRWADTVAKGKGPGLAIIVAPHPDDEVVMGGLPFRWQREEGWTVRVVTVTLGSKEARREEREAELRRACDLLGWELEVLGWRGVDRDGQRPDPDRVSVLRERLRPADAVFFPHEQDGHPAHVGVNRLVRAALEGVERVPRIFLTEFWQPMQQPNLLVEVAPDDVACLVEALACHAGEVSRNPYHRRLPAWMMDNVRRGAEQVGGAGSEAPDFPFGLVYRMEPEPEQRVLRVGRSLRIG
ncbi:MAG: PIG-L family deacetylase [Verrucomicrobiia bacterium]